MQERAKRTQESIIEAAAREFAEKGFQATTTKTVAARAGVSVGSVYRYFSDKSDLLFQVATRRYARLLDQIKFAEDLRREDLASVARRSVRAVLEYHRHLSGLNEVLKTRRRVDSKIDELATHTDEVLIGRTVEMLERLGASGDLLFTAFNLLSMMQAAVLAHLAAPMLDDRRFIEGLADAVESLVRARLPAAETPRPAAGADAPQPSHDRDAP